MPDALWLALHALASFGVGLLVATAVRAGSWRSPLPLSQVRAYARRAGLGMAVAWPILFAALVLVLVLLTPIAVVVAFRRKW